MADKGISAINYNYLNLPVTISSSQGNTNYIYRADGVKLKKTYGTAVTAYLDGFQYENNLLQFIPTVEGYYDFIKNAYIYNYTDHLGNVRLSYYKNSAGALTIDTESNYYPFGLEHTDYNNLVGNSKYNYKYNGKELQETGMYDYGARMYMPDIGRWGVVDPLAEAMRRHSPYNYAFNNPIMFIDPDGMAPAYNWDTGKYMDGDKEVSFDQAVAYYDQGGDPPGKTNDRRQVQSHLECQKKNHSLN
ncbi:RHS repeat-associated core domain-containing protein [Chryseobacterium salivictor]|nr:RHS repeat-associated core domain-containing protein [Chryseobacterium salivictor]